MVIRGSIKDIYSMKILNISQIRNLDSITIQKKGIPSIDLMEKASKVFVDWFMEHYPKRTAKIHIYCGPGNNGGDGLAIGRMLSHHSYTVTFYLAQVGKNRSIDYNINLNKLDKLADYEVFKLFENSDFPDLPEDGIIIDALWGSGLTRPVGGYWGDLLEHLSNAKIVVSVDMPSGLFADQHTSGNVIRASKTLTFEMPKLSFFFPENAEYLGDWHFRSIGLDQETITSYEVENHLIDEDLVADILHIRRKFDHKGIYGHALIIAGGYGKVGAALLAGNACLRSGPGLLTIHAPRIAYPIIQSTLPEAMVSIDNHEFTVSDIPSDITPYSAIGIGCGIGTNKVAICAMENLLSHSNIPTVIDADGLNIMSMHPQLLNDLPEQVILTPHVKEFTRLFGSAKDDFERNKIQREASIRLNCTIILKGAHSAITTPHGLCYFNNTGNPGMATGGSGDVLTGILTGLLAQGYTTSDAAILGTYVHGLAGDLATVGMSYEALIAGDIIGYLGAAFKHIKKCKKSLF